MPKTKFQSVVFTLMMVFSMVYCMSVYTISLGQGGLSYHVFLTALQEMWVEYVIVFLLIFFLITKTALKLAGKLIDPTKNSPILTTVAIQSLTVMMIVPLITLFATFLHSGFTGRWFTQWITTAVLCFPVAYCLQVFYVGPPSVPVPEDLPRSCLIRARLQSMREPANAPDHRSFRRFVCIIDKEIIRTAACMPQQSAFPMGCVCHVYSK